ncbi:hypothetical protein ACFQL1_19930 [Halomicroarcula sp. GCM10025709]|uniref:DUF7510 family protein n=1 Tax=Haloarcula TaxID=2237 RepID=UPI0024C2F3F5|nr:hypothetical protein [Halomicroarcula sp. YJ-61-S]
MSDSEDASGGRSIPISIDVDIDDGRTVITATGDRDAAVVVESRSGERIYLPPEDFERPPDSAADTPHADSPYQSVESDSPYQSADSDSPYQPAESDSPYQSADNSDSPYQSGGDVSERAGLSPTGDGFRIVHPEPVTDLRVLR